MSGRHGNKRKKKKTPYTPAIEVVVEESRCQEHPDQKSEDDMNETDKNNKRFIDLLKDKVFDTAAAALFVSILALAAYLWQACIMRTSMRIDQRAWVGFGEIKSFTIEDGVPFEIKIPLKNTGKSFAINLGAGLISKLDDTDKRPDGDFALAKWMGDRVVVLLPEQSQEMNNAAFGGLPIGTRERLKSQNQTIWVFGKVLYTDMFGIDHWTRYCYKTVRDEIEGVKFRPCEFYAGVDRNQE
jgi:hypothetical protein